MVAAELRAIADTAERRLLQVAAHFADLHLEPHGWDGLSPEPSGPSPRAS